MSEIANDPTQAGVAVPETGGARLTLPEIQSLCFKAARGAGMEWGLAEEAAFAARWLAAAGLPGPERLGARLQAGGVAAPEIGSGVWRGRAGGALGVREGAFERLHVRRLSCVQVVERAGQR